MVCSFFQGIRFHYTEECSLPKEIVSAKTMLYKNTKVKVRSHDGNAEFFEKVIVETKMDAFYADDLVLLTDTSVQDENCCIAWSRPAEAFVSPGTLKNS